MTEEELRVLAWTILGEAAGEGTVGMEAVAHVIRNRALSGRFPSNPASVALQSSASGIHQFSAWNALTQGGNIPRARYPVGSAAFNRALAVVSKVFGPTPGKDPTQGATHYYSPKGMAEGAAPYWWNSEAPRGGKKIGGHIFAVKRDDAVAPTPAERSMTSPGSFPSRGQLEVFRTGAPLRLPTVGPSGGPSLKAAPVPARQSLAMQVAREDAGATVRSTSTMIYDPVKNTLVKPMPSAREVIRAAQAEQRDTRSDRPTAKTVQRVAGFSVPGGVAGIAQVDKTRAAPKVSASDKARAAKVLPKPIAQTQFAQPTGSLAQKDQSRLPSTAKGIDPVLPPVASGGRSRDAVAARAAGVEAAKRFTAPKTPPMPVPRPQRPPVPVAKPQLAPLKIVVQRDPVAEVIRQPPKPQSLYYTDPIAFGNASVSQSGDTSVGSQADAAAARASGEAWRNSR